MKWFWDLIEKIPEKAVLKGIEKAIEEFDVCCVCGKKIHWKDVREDDAGNVYCPDHAPADAIWVREGPSTIIKIPKGGINLGKEKRERRENRRT